MYQVYSTKSGVVINNTNDFSDALKIALDSSRWTQHHAYYVQRPTKSGTLRDCVVCYRGKAYTKLQFEKLING